MVGVGDALKVMTRDGIVTLSQIYIYACKVRKMLCKTKTRLQSGAKHELVTKNVMYPRELSPTNNLVVLKWYASPMER